MITYVLIFLAVIGFTAVMAKDVISSKNLINSSKILWIIAIILLPVIGAYIYYIARKKY